MNAHVDDNSVEQELRKLESRLEQLAALCERLRRENELLRSQQNTWTTERAGFLDRQERARSRVEAMIGRLKAMEQSS